MNKRYEELARKRADYIQARQKLSERKWFDIYQEGLENKELLDDFESYLFDIEEAKRDGEMPR